MWMKVMGYISWQRAQAMGSACCAVGNVHLTPTFLKSRHPEENETIVSLILNLVQTSWGL